MGDKLKETNGTDFSSVLSTITSVCLGIHLTSLRNCTDVMNHCFKAYSLSQAKLGYPSGTKTVWHIN